MSNFVDDLTSLPYPKANRKQVQGNANQYIDAADWNGLCQGAVDLRGYSLRAGGHDGSTGGAAGGHVPFLKLPVGSDLLISGSNANSRDTPINTVAFQNIGLPNNPVFRRGNPYLAGIGLEADGLWYSDDTMISGGVRTWKIVASHERSGTLATILDGVERSAYESFLNNGDFKPWMRIEASSRGINFGSACRATAGNVNRSGNVTTVTTVTPHRFSVGDALWKTTDPYSGNAADLALFGPDSTSGSSFTVLAVVNANAFRYSDPGANGASLGAILYSKETDVGFGRDATGVAAVRVNGSTVCQFVAAGILLPSGLSVLSAGASLQLGAAGVGSLEVSDTTVHVQAGKTFYQEGTYRSTGWYNAGGQTQTTQEVFNVGTGSGAKSTALRAISGVDWMVLRVINDGEGGAGNNLTINPAGGNTIKGGASLVIPAYAAATLVSVGTDWKVMYHPAAP